MHLGDERSLVEQLFAQQLDFGLFAQSGVVGLSDVGKELCHHFHMHCRVLTNIHWREMKAENRNVLSFLNLPHNKHKQTQTF